MALDRKYQGSRDQEIVGLLRGLKLDVVHSSPSQREGERGRIDEMNTLLGKSTLARVLRRLGQAPEAERMWVALLCSLLPDLIKLTGEWDSREDDTAQLIRSRPLIAVPSVIRLNLIGKDEEESPIIKRLGPDYFDRYQEHPYVPGKGWYMDVRDLPGKPPGTVSRLFLPTSSSSSSSGRDAEKHRDPPVTLVAPCEVDKSERRVCWVSGCRIMEDLKICQSPTDK